MNSLERTTISDEDIGPLNTENIEDNFYKMILASIIYYKFHRDRANHLGKIDKSLHFCIILLSSCLTGTNLNDLVNVYSKQFNENKAIIIIVFIQSFFISVLSLIRRIYKFDKKSLIHGDLAKDFRIIMNELQFIKDYKNLSKKDYYKIELLYKKTIHKNMLDFNDHTIKEFYKKNKDITENINSLHNLSILPLTLIPEIINYKTLINSDKLKRFFDNNIDNIINGTYIQNTSNEIINTTENIDISSINYNSENIINKLYKNIKNKIFNFISYFRHNYENEYEKIPLKNDTIIVDT